MGSHTNKSSQSLGLVSSSRSELTRKYLSNKRPLEGHGFSSQAYLVELPMILSTLPLHEFLDFSWCLSNISFFHITLLYPRPSRTLPRPADA